MQITHRRPPVPRQLLTWMRQQHEAKATLSHGYDDELEDEDEDEDPLGIDPEDLDDDNEEDFDEDEE